MAYNLSRYLYIKREIDHIFIKLILTFFKKLEKLSLIRLIALKNQNHQTIFS